MELQPNITSVFLLAVALTFPADAQSRKTPRQEIVQTHFTAQDAGVRSPISIPPEVLRVLGEDDLVKSQMDNEEPRPTQVPQSWFSASKIQLGHTREDGIIVQATGPLVGANVVAFWVFVQTHDRWKQALMIPAHDLIVMPTRFNGYRNIEADAMTCCAITTTRFRFNANEYRRYFSKTEEIK